MNMKRVRIVIATAMSILPRRKELSNPYCDRVRVRVRDEEELGEEVERERERDQPFPAAALLTPRGTARWGAFARGRRKRTDR